MSMVKSSLKRWHWIAGPTCFVAASLCFKAEVTHASDCTACDATGNSCPTIMIALPEVPCLGNGLFDHFNRFADRFSRQSSCNCTCTSNTCDGPCDSLAVSNQLMPTYTARTHSYDESTSTLQLPSEVPAMPSAPAPIPAPEPTDGYRTRTPAKASDPFIDEARSKIKRSTLPSSIGYEEVHVMKMNSRLAALMNPSRNQAIAKKVEQDASEPNVITVGGTISSEEKFVQ
jgi:hypothetical protein